MTLLQNYVSKYFWKRIEMRILIILLAICTIFYSCNDDHYIYYRYGDVVVTRIDKDIGESYFYYGLYKPTDTLPSSYVDAIYRRGSDLMWAYLIFDNNKKIKLISLGDWFEKVGNDTMVTLVDYSTKENDTTVNWNLKLSGHPNVIYVDRYLPREQEENVKRKTSVKATY